VLFCLPLGPGGSRAMAASKERWHLLTSIVFCALAVVFGTLLYPLILLFFSLVALLDSIFRHLAAFRFSSSSRPPSEGRGA